MIFTLDIESSLQKLLSQEDTDGDNKITIEDKGPKEFTVTSKKGQKEVLKGTYYLSNLLQELIIQKLEGKKIAHIPLNKIKEPPVQRISRMIREYYWNGLTRSMDKNGILKLISDTKNESLTADFLPVYVPFDDDLAFAYYKKLENTLPIKLVRLPKDISPSYVKSIDKKPGILSLKLECNHGKIKGIPFVVPGGRFNEMYGWDSYFESIGLILDGKVQLAKAMADNFQYQIKHYGKILNANRSYYLTRTQPPFYTSLISEVFEITKDLNWLESHLKTAIDEYFNVWMVEGKRLTENGLNRYLAEGIGIPPETEEGHFDTMIRPLADALNISVEDYTKGYNSGKIKNSDLDLYFLHDRSVRESGHDTSWRLDGNCADLNTVDLNSLLYKYESDIAHLIEVYFGGELHETQSAFWFQVMFERAKRMDELMWNEEHGQYFDYNFKKAEQIHFESASNYFPLWAGLINGKDKVESIVKTLTTQIKEKGGIAGTSRKMNANLRENAMQRQWDYPNGWAPHQMMIWKGLLHYGYEDLTQELIYRWLYMITRNAVDYNGTIPEKYDVVEATHKVFSEYGNVGTDFNYITQEGFGWMNASYQYGLSLLKDKYVIKLNKLEIPSQIFN